MLPALFTEAGGEGWRIGVQLHEENAETDGFHLLEADEHDGLADGVYFSPRPVVGGIGQAQQLCRQGLLVEDNPLEFPDRSHFAVNHLQQPLQTTGKGGKIGNLGDAVEGFLPSRHNR